jgi:hypothetical protein
MSTNASAPLRVISVSLGSSTRDFSHTSTMLGREVQWGRQGTDGDMGRAIRLIGELDGKVDAIGLGGIDLYLIAAGRKFVIRDAQKMAQAAKITPVVDGSGLKHTLERQTVRWLQDTGTIDFRGKKVMLVSGVDRFGMAETLPECGAITQYGDLIFAFGIPYAIKSLAGLKTLAWTCLPLVCRLPFKMLYPTGAKQETTSSKYGKYFAWPDIIAGDFLFIRRYMPERLDGKIIITNTTTENDVALLRQRGVKMLVTSTPSIEGRSSGTNVLEGVFVALAGKTPAEMTPQDYLDLMSKIGWEPNVVRL